MINTRLVAVGIAFIILVSTASAVFFTTTYTSGWEIGNQLESALVNEVPAYPDRFNTGFINGSYLNSRGGFLKIDDGDPANMNSEVFSAIYSENPEYWGSTAVWIDVDAPYPVRRIEDGPWYKSADGSPYKTYSVLDANGTAWFYDHYVYHFTVDIKTDGLAEKVIYTSWVGPIPITTSWVYGTCEGLSQNRPLDHEARIRLFVQFGLSPWSIFNGQVFQENNSRIAIANPFYGIMSASVAQLEIGSLNPELDSEPFDIKWGGLAQPHKDHVGASLAMWRDDDSSFAGYPSVVDEALEEYVVTNAASSIPKSVTIEVGADLEPGLIVDNDLLGFWLDWTPINKYVRYVIRVDAVYSAGLVLLSGDQDPAGQKQEDQPPDEVRTLWEKLGAFIDDVFLRAGTGLSDFLNSIIAPLVVIAMIAIVVLICFFFGGRRE